MNSIKIHSLEKVRLTQLVKSAGCAAKIFPHILSEALSGIEWYSNENVLIGFDGKDDAGIYKINDELALIHTTDFFTPVVDDPFTYGQIAATNALSDIYAMGGTPINALNIVAFPQTQDLEILKEILNGGMQKAREADCPVIGGHSVDIPDILYGMAVTGTAKPDDIKSNDGAKPGDVLILTKPLGTGILNNCVKFKELESGEIYDMLISSMTTLNKKAAGLMVKYKANACTDITGFGLAGHAMQLAKASRVGLEIIAESLPIFSGVYNAIDEKMMTRGDRSNREYTDGFITWEREVDKYIDHVIYDPQTSGGLLICLPPENKESFLQEINATVIGYVKEGTGIKLV